MSLINIQFDTQTKKMSATINGTPFTGVTGITIYPNYEDSEKWDIDVSMRDELKEDNVVIYTSITASKDNARPISEYIPDIKDKLVHAAYVMLGKKQPFSA